MPLYTRVAQQKDVSGRDTNSNTGEDSSHEPEEQHYRGSDIVPNLTRMTDHRPSDTNSGLPEGKQKQESTCFFFLDISIVGVGEFEFWIFLLKNIRKYQLVELQNS
jgi:hypothetical protein